MRKKILGVFVMTLLPVISVLPMTLTVAHNSVDNPPVVVIDYPPDGAKFAQADITVTGYASDDIGLSSFGRLHEWSGGQEATSGTFPPPGPEYHSFEEHFTLYNGWNRITIFVSDTGGQGGEDVITVYYYIDTEPPQVVIESPSDGSTVFNPDITVEGYATDNIALASFGRLHEWTGGEVVTSGTFPPPGVDYHSFDELLTLYEGWNRITIFVSDTVGYEGSDSIVLTYVINSPPNKPSKPSGPTSGNAGTSYTFSTSTTDPDGDQVYYQWDWGDEVSPWDGPYYSGDTIMTSHTWSNQGTYAVKVKAKDTNNAESVLSDPLSVTMPRNKPFINTPFLQFLTNHPHLFPILQRVLRIQ